MWLGQDERGAEESFRFPVYNVLDGDVAKRKDSLLAAACAVSSPLRYAEARSRPLVLADFREFDVSGSAQLSLEVNDKLSSADPRHLSPNEAVALAKQL